MFRYFTIQVEDKVLLSRQILLDVHPVWPSDALDVLTDALPHILRVVFVDVLDEISETADSVVIHALARVLAYPQFGRSLAGKTQLSEEDFVSSQYDLSLQLDILPYQI